MNDDRPTDTAADAKPAAGPVRTTMLVFPAGDDDCEHPDERLEARGDDGTNVYYRCTRCGAGLVAKDAVARLGRAAGTESAR